MSIFFFNFMKRFLSNLKSMAAAYIVKYVEHSALNFLFNLKHSKRNNYVAPNNPFLENVMYLEM